MPDLSQGQVARISVAITDINGNAADPTSLLLKVKFPDGSLVTHIWDVIKDSIGNYHYDQSLILPGSYRIRWESSGINQGAVEEALYVFPASM